MGIREMKVMDQVRGLDAILKKFHISGDPMFVSTEPYRIRILTEDTRTLFSILTAFNNGSCKWESNMLGINNVENHIQLDLIIPGLSGEGLKREIEYKICMLKQQIGI